MRLLAISFILCISPIAQAVADPSALAAVVGRPHICENYPPAAIRAGVDGEIGLAFTIGTDGTTSDVRVITSSGNADLDQAAVSCVATWLYRPAMQNGEPVAVPWKVNVVFFLPSVEVPSMSHIGSDCPAYRPTGHTESAAEKGTLLSFIVGANGAVQDPFVADPSGDAGLDAIALQCATSWKFRPAMHFGKLVDKAWDASLKWMKDSGSAVAMDGSHTIFESSCADKWYPTDALKAGTGGTTVLTFNILQYGRVDDIAVRKSSGDVGLDQAAMSCARSWYYPVSNGDPNFKKPWAVWVIWRYGHAFVLQMGEKDDPLAPD